MKFARIEMLFLIWVLPVLLLAYLYGWRKRRGILNAFAAPRTLADLVPAGIAGRRRWAAVLVLSASLLAVLAMAGPQYGFQWREIERRGVDIIIALDCSRSMLATDIQPNRLDRPNGRSLICSTCWKVTGWGWWPSAAAPFCNAP